MRLKSVVPMVLACMLLLLCSLLGGCRGTANPGVDKVCIGDYVLCVEEAIGDRYNARIRYSLKRQDGRKMEPETHFASIRSRDSRSCGGSIQYDLSEDERTLWIEVQQSSGNKYNSRELHTVTLENLSFGDKSGLETIAGTWDVSFRIQVQESYKELLRHDMEIPLSKDEIFYAQISSIQLSAMGIHMEMKLSDNDINELVNHFKSSLLLKDGSFIELELHHSIRGNRAPYDATAEAMFGESIPFNEVDAVIVCGHAIPVNAS